MCFAVMSDFPSAEHWWMALGKICTPSLFCLTPISFAEDKKISTLFFKLPIYFKILHFFYLDIL